MSLTRVACNWLGRVALTGGETRNVLYSDSGHTHTHTHGRVKANGVADLFPVCTCSDSRSRKDIDNGANQWNAFTHCMSAGLYLLCIVYRDHLLHALQRACHYDKLFINSDTTVKCYRTCDFLIVNLFYSGLM